MTAGDTASALEVIFDRDAGEQQWLSDVLGAVVRHARASAGLAYAWGPPHARVTERAWTDGGGLAAESLSTALFELPGEWFVRLHRLPRPRLRFERQLARLPPELRRGLKQRLDAWSGPHRNVHALVPVATRQRGIGLLVAVSVASAPAARARQALDRLAEPIATAFALRRTTGGRRARGGSRQRASDERSIWRDLFDGKWAILRAERTPTSNGLVLSRLPIDVRRDPRSISAREGQVLALALEGRSNKWIAWKLGITTATVASHLRRTNAKLGVRSRSELLAFFGPASSTS